MTGNRLLVTVTRSSLTFAAGSEHQTLINQRHSSFSVSGTVSGAGWSVSLNPAVDVHVKLSRSE